jgi:DNA-binding transcriptional regulator YhcF (GntR family)
MKKENNTTKPSERSKQFLKEDIKELLKKAKQELTKEEIFELLKDYHNKT